LIYLKVSVPFSRTDEIFVVEKGAGSCNIKGIPGVGPQEVHLNQHLVTDQEEIDNAGGIISTRGHAYEDCLVAVASKILAASLASNNSDHAFFFFFERCI
jgi:hypothetical protein